MRMETAMSGQPNEVATFDIEKAIAAIGYLVERTGETMYPVMKMMYLADKLHLQRYGRFITGDQYCAMHQGPVPSGAYNMLKHVRGEKQSSTEFSRASKCFIYHADHRIELRGPIDYEAELSGGEIACLQAIVEAYTKLGKWAVRDMSHDQAWNQAWSSKGFFRRSVKIDAEKIALQFDEGKALVKHMRDRHLGEAKLPRRDSCEKSETEAA
jgi:uncharacterized phage-associated protein